MRVYTHSQPLALGLRLRLRTARTFSNLSPSPPKSAWFNIHIGATALLEANASFELWSFGPLAERRAAPHAMLASPKPIVLMHGDGGDVLDGEGGRGSTGEAALRFPFTPRDELQRLLPAARRVVAHLRVGDEHEASRRGLFREPNATDALRAILPMDAYVLSDSGDVYRALCDARACPEWRAIPHSAERAMRPPDERNAIQTLRTWADWWSIRAATGLVLATPSAFASSALLFSKAERCELNDVADLERCAANTTPKDETPARGGDKSRPLHVEL